MSGEWRRACGEDVVAVVEGFVLTVVWWLLDETRVDSKEVIQIPTKDVYVVLVKMVSATTTVVSSKSIVMI